MLLLFTMKWFLSFFKQTSNGNGEKKKLNEYSINIKLYSTSNFKGINTYVLSQLFFINQAEKSDFLDNFNRIMDSCGINEHTSSKEFHEAISSYELRENVWLQFYRLIVDFDFFNVTDKKGEISKVIQGNIKIVDSFDDLIKSNLGLHIADFNIKNKLKHKIFDIEFEEKLILDTLKKEMEYDYERLDNYIFLALSYDELGNSIKFDYYLKKIESEYRSYKMAESVIGNKFKEMGEFFLVRNDNKNALKWLELGVEIYPKLGVKRKIIELKTKLNNE